MTLSPFLVILQIVFPMIPLLPAILGSPFLKEAQKINYPKKNMPRHYASSCMENGKDKGKIFQEFLLISVYSGYCINQLGNITFFMR